MENWIHTQWKKELSLYDAVKFNVCTEAMMNEILKRMRVE